MIRFILISPVLFFFILLAGCTDDDSSYMDNISSITYLQVHIPRTNIESRTIGSPTTPGTPEENAISDVTIYLMNDNRIAKVESITMSKTLDNYISDLIPIGKDMLDQEFQLFVVANPKKADFSIRTTSDFKGIYSTQSNTYKLVTPEQMVMSNQVEQAPVPTVVVTKENTEDNPAVVKVRLDRLAVKIEPQASVNFEVNFSNRPKESVFFEGYTFDVKAAGLLNAPTEFNLKQFWSDVANSQPIQLLSPTWYYKPEVQFFDKYYSTIKDYTDSSTPPFIQIDNEDNGTGYRLISSPFYCLENNSPFYDYTGSNLTPENQIKTKYKGLATGVIFKVQVTKENNPVTFYRFEGKYYSDTEADKLELSEVANLSISDFTNIGALRAKGIKVYKDGNIYYTYWIKDKNPAYSG